MAMPSMVGKLRLRCAAMVVPRDGCDRLLDRMETADPGGDDRGRPLLQRFSLWHPAGSPQGFRRRAMMIFLCAGAARQDAAATGWQYERQGRSDQVSARQERGEADLAILPDLATELEHVPRSDPLFLTHTGGRAYKPEPLGSWFKDVCVAAGLMHCTAHGLRKVERPALPMRGNGTGSHGFSCPFHPEGTCDRHEKAGRAQLADSGLAKVAGS